MGITRGSFHVICQIISYLWVIYLHYKQCSCSRYMNCALPATFYTIDNNSTACCFSISFILISLRSEKKSGVIFHNNSLSKYQRHYHQHCCHKIKLFLIIFRRSQPLSSTSSTYNHNTNYSLFKFPRLPPLPSI